MMSKKDYQAIAAAFYLARVAAETSTASPLATVDYCGRRIAEVLASSNPCFDRRRFIEACETGTCRGMRAV